MIQQAGEVDILVNNAGVFPGGATHEIDERTFDETFAVNVKAPFFLTAALAPRMAERGHGAIINITTMVAEFGMPGLSVYGASKAATALLTKAWAAEYGPHGVRVNAVSPGPTRTPGTDAMGEGFTQIVGTIPAWPSRQPAGDRRGSRLPRLRSRELHERRRRPRRWRSPRSLTHPRRIPLNTRRIGGSR